MMRASRLMATLLWGLLVVTSPAAAGMAVIETTAPLSDASDGGVKTAVVAAVQNAARGARAMGLSRIAVNGIQVLPKMVIIRVVATDSATLAMPGELDMSNPSAWRGAIPAPPER